MTELDDSGRPSSKEVYAILRAQIEHEDALCDQRMTWLISLQSFLFGAYGFSLSAASALQGRDPGDIIQHSRVAFAFVGMMSPIAIIFSVWSGFRSIGKLVDRWHHGYAAYVDAFPQIIGNHSKIWTHGTYLGQVPLFTLPTVFFVAWAYVSISNTPIVEVYIIPMTVIVTAVSVAFFLRFHATHKRRSHPGDG